MRRTIMKLGIALALLVGGGGVGLAQNFDAGWATIERGDYATAFREWSLLASQGDAAAQYNLGVMYDEGKGVTQDFREAVKWYRLSAAQGVASAQVNLGAKYTNGEGVIQDFREAVKWYRLSAAQGNAKAQANLGAMYANGQGVIQDDVYAHMWANMAAAQGNEIAASNRNLVAKKMTNAQIAQAQELARQCVAKNYKGC